MAKRYEVYRCAVCGNVVEVVHGGEGALFCCGRDMKLFSERTVDPADQPYKPVIEATAEGVKVSVGKTPHAMDDDHHIQWVEILADGFQCRRYLKSGDKPEAVFQIKGENLRARAYCTQHGLCL